MARSGERVLVLTHLDRRVSFSSAISPTTCSCFKKGDSSLSSLKLSTNITSGHPANRLDLYSTSSTMSAPTPASFLASLATRRSIYTISKALPEGITQTSFQELVYEVSATSERRSRKPDRNDR